MPLLCIDKVNHKKGIREYMKGKLIRGAGLLCLIAFCAFPAAAEDETVISDGVFIGDKNVSGMTVEEAEDYVADEVAALASSQITLQMGDDKVTSSWAELGFTWENTDLVQEVSELGTTGNIIQRYKEQKDLENNSAKYEIEYELNEDAETSFVRSLASYNSEPVEGSVYMGSDGALCVEGGTDGLTLDVDATLVSLKKYLAEEEPGDVVIEATADAQSPILTADTLSKMTDVLGTATTDYSASSYSRAQNVENGTAMINGTLLMPGESFSVTDAVTPFTADNGYALAPSYEAGSVVDSYGGGICQVSTTLYNAVLKSELEVEQRSNHTMTVSYVDPSKDAAIAEGTMDLVFTNNQDYPIYISGDTYGGTLTFTIYGVDTRPENRSIEFVSEVLSETDASTNLTLVAKTDQTVGYLSQVQTAHEGMTATLWKETYVDGVLSETTQVNSSNYSATPAIYEVGVVTSNSTLYSEMLSAINSNDLSKVESLIANGVAESETSAQSESNGITVETAGETGENTVVNVDEEMAADAAAADTILGTDEAGDSYTDSYLDGYSDGYSDVGADNSIDSYSQDSYQETIILE